MLIRRKHDSAYGFTNHSEFGLLYVFFLDNGFLQEKQEGYDLLSHAEYILYRYSFLLHNKNRIRLFSRDFRFRYKRFRERIIPAIERIFVKNAASELLLDTLRTILPISATIHR